MRFGLPIPLIALGCPGRQPPPVPADVSVAHADERPAYLYTGEPRDPASFVGLFADDRYPLDHRDTKRLSCSSYFEAEFHEAPYGGPLVFSTTQAGAPIAGIDVGKAQRVNDGYASYVELKSAGTTSVVVTDAKGLQRCCLSQPDQCRPTYVSVLVHGEGQVYWQTAEGEWERGAKLTGVIGFETSRNLFGEDGCGSWIDSVPEAYGGQFFAGVSARLSSEERAREAALYDARQKARRWIQDHGQGDSLLEQLADLRWCIQEIPNATGSVDYSVHVLSFLPMAR